MSQDPVAGTKVPIGSSVNLVISLGRPTVPDVVGMHQSDAKPVIRSFSLLVGQLTFEYSDTVPDGYVISQSPVAGTVVLVGTPVNLVVSLGKPFVPNVIGLTEAEASYTFNALTLVVGTVTHEYSDTIEAGLVISQDPVPYTIVLIGSAVDIVVSRGKPVVPNVVGLLEVDANSVLSEATLVPGAVVYEYNDVVPKDVVMRQNPVAGTTVFIGWAVDLVVSLGQPIVPDVVGMLQADANAAILSVYSLSVGTVSYQHSDTVPEGIVISQDPTGGTAVPIGSAVDIVVSLGKPVVPDVVGMSEADANDALSEVSLRIGAVTYIYDPNLPEGIVISQEPVSGTVVLVNSTVDLVVSLAVVPDIVGLSKVQARVVLADHGFVIGLSTYEYSDTVATATVMTQSPAAGAKWPVGSPIDLHVSLGRPYYGILLGGQRLVELQNNDGGWDYWPLDDGDPNAGSDLDTFASAATGLVEAYRQTEEPNMLAALQKAKSYLLSKTDTFVVKDGVAAAELDSVLGGSACEDHMRSNFFGRLDAGTYYDAIYDALYDTAGYIQAMRDRRVDEGIANHAAWDMGVGLYGAHLVGAKTGPWLEAVKSEIDELDGDYGYDVLGLAGAILGLAAVGEDYDPQAGEHAAASNLSDLADILTTYQIGTGGFTWQSTFMLEYFDESVLETACSLMALIKVDKAAYLTQVSDAGNYLYNAQLPTGGWENFLDWGGERNESTGEAIRAMAAALPLLGDFNNDGDTNFVDFSIFASTWLKDETDPAWKPVCDISDPNDGVIDAFDLGVFVENWLGGVR